MSEDLRSQVIVAAAKAYYEMERKHVDPGLGWPPWEQLGKFGQRSHLEFMNVALDAVLDTLTDNADETVHVEEKSWRSARRLADIHADQLIDALRSPSSKTRTGDL